MLFPSKRQLKQLIATLCIGSISLGILIAWTSPVVPQLENPITSFGINKNEVSWIGSILGIGSFISAILVGYLADCYGRKNLLLALVFPVTVFTFFVLVADNVYCFYVARFFSGMATGGISVIGPMYIGEIADVEMRGILGSFFEFLIYVGIVTTAVIGAYYNYKFLTVLVGLISVVLGAGLFYFPETPSYYIMKKQPEKAEKSLMFFRENSEIVKTELESLQKKCDAQVDKTFSNFSKLWSSKAAIRGLVACIGLTIFQQLSGVDAIAFYCVTIFQTSATYIDPYSCSIIVSVTQLLSACLSIFIIEKLNRTTFLYLSAIGTGISLAAMGAYFHLKHINDTDDLPTLIPLLSIVIFFISYSLGLGPIPWLLNSELFSSEIKGLANGITIAFNWIFLFVVTKMFPLFIEWYEPFAVFYAFAICMIFCIIFVIFCVPETKGKSLQEIQEKLNK